MNTTLIRQKIISRQIKTWQDVYGYTTPAEMSKKLGRGPKYWESMRKDPLKMSLGSAFKFIEEVGISKARFYELVGGGD